MINAVNIALIVLGCVALIPVAVLFIECVAALFAGQPSATPSSSRPARVAVLISAHNEELLIQSTIDSLLPQLLPNDEILIVADNCTDNTAALARAAGATVTVRNNPELRGKGYGLSHGLEVLRTNPPDVVIFFDADCTVESDVVERLAAEAWEAQRPVQARYLLASPRSAGARGTISTLAFIVKNAVRPAGLAALGFPCALTGTGMAFPWRLIENAPVASGHIVEDMELGLHLMRQGAGPMLCTAVTINGAMPGDCRFAYQQRTRWEHGHLTIICTRAIPLLLEGIVRLRPSMIATALDLMVPPLALLTMVWTVGAAAAVTLGVLTHLWFSSILFAASGSLFAISIAAARHRHAQHVPMKSLLAVPAYIAWKIPLYLGFVFKRQTNWVRTNRGPESIPAAEHLPTTAHTTEGAPTL